MKRYAANLLLVLGLVVAGTSAVVAHLARAVLDEEAFSERLVAALDRPAVGALVAHEIANGVVAANRDLTGVRPVITAMAQGLIRTPAFHALARRGARDAHALLFSEGAERVMLSMPDVGVLLRGALETVSPQIAQRIPASVRTVIETRMTGTVGARVIHILRAAARVQQLARSGVVVGLMLMGLALLVAPERRQALLNTGIGLMSLAALLALSIPLGRAAIAGAVADPALRPVAAELWTVFAGGFRQWALGIGIAAGMVMAAVAAVLEPTRLKEAARRAVRELAGRQPTAPREFARIAGLLLLGTFAIAAPLETLSVAAVAAGVLLLAMTMYEAVAFVAPPRATTAGDAERLGFNPGLAIGIGTVLLISAGLGAIAALPWLRPAAVVAAAEPVLACNGYVSLCERPFDEVTFAGAHNAMGSAADPRWLFPNQDGSIPDLLQRGVRAFMVDVHQGHPVEDRIKTDFQSEDERRKYETAIGPEAFAAAMRVRDRLVGAAGPAGLYMCHGFCELGATPFDTLLAQVRTFLVQHPGEVVMLVIEDYATASESMAAFERQGLVPFTYRGPWRAPFPTLGTLVRTGQRLIVLSEHQGDSTSWYYPAYDLMQETPYTFHKPADFSCRPNRGGAKNPLLLMNHWIETTPAPRPSNAVLVNTQDMLVTRARECRRLRGRLPNVLAVDFAGIGDVVGASEVLNGLKPATPTVVPATAAGR
jgi:hypothetical protein